MNENDKKFAEMLGEGEIVKVNAFIKEQGYTPTIKTLAVALQRALSRTDPAAARVALAWKSEDQQGKKVHYQLYDAPYQFSGGESYGGLSAWLALIKSGKGPGHKGFDECADLLAGQEIGLNAFLKAGEASSDRLADHLCTRGWTRIAPRLEQIAGQRFKASAGKDIALQLALQSGHGSAGLWALSRGASGGRMSVIHGAKGVFNPLRPEAGACDASSWEERALGLRIGAKISGLSAIDATLWKTTMSDPMSSPERLLCWLMARSAWAQSETLDPQVRQSAMAGALSSAQGHDWTEINNQHENPSKGLFSFFSKTTADPNDLRSGFMAEAATLIRTRQGLSSGVLPSVLAWIDKGDFDQARKALNLVAPDALVHVCVELLGLAKTGYWDMPMPQEGSFDPNERHPMRWAGFKLALHACGENVSKPIPGLSGTTLAGLCTTLGFEDAISELISAGASLEPDELAQGPSPLWLALRHGRTRFAQVLLEAGASPIEGVKVSPFGYPTRDWAIHLALDMRQDKLIEDMLNADPRSAQLPDRNGLTILDRAFALKADGPGEEDKVLGSKILSVAERAILSKESRTATSRRVPAL